MPMVKGTANNGATPIYGTEPRPQATDQGDDTMGYDSSYSTGYFGPQNEYGDQNWMGNKYIAGYNDVFVADTPPADTTADLGTLGGVTSTPPADTTADLGTLGGVTSTPPADTTSTPPGKPIYGTQPMPEQTDLGQDDFGYESSYTTGYFSEPDPETGDQDWIGNPTDEIIGYEPPTLQDEINNHHLADDTPNSGTIYDGVDEGQSEGLGALANINPSGYVTPQSNIQDVYGTANMPEHRFFSYGV